MRITGGQYKNRKLYVPDGQDIRPTSDRMRQMLFNILHHADWAQNFDINDATVLDLFCGTGALGLEALSHGAKHCLFIDRDIHTVQRNTAFLGQGDYRIVKANALAFGKGQGDVNLVFMDPPYGMNLVESTVQNLMDHNWLADRVIFVIETEKGLNLKTQLHLIETRTQSQSTLHFLRYEIKM